MRKFIPMGAALLILAGISLSQAHAATVFASVSNSGDPNKFVYSDATGAFSLTETVNFSYSTSHIIGVPSAGLGPFTAIFKLSGVEKQSAVQGGNSLDQRVDDVNFSIIGASGPATGMNLLSGSSIGNSGSYNGGADISGKDGTQIANLDSSYNFLDPKANQHENLDTIVFTSDYLIFPVAKQKSITLTLNIANNEALAVDVNNFFDFQATTSGDFGYDPSPIAKTPEPGMVAMLMSIGVSGSVFAFRRRRKLK